MASSHIIILFTQLYVSPFHPTTLPHTHSQTEQGKMQEKGSGIHSFTSLFSLFCFYNANRQKLIDTMDNTSEYAFKQTEAIQPTPHQLQILY